MHGRVVLACAALGFSLGAGCVARPVRTMQFQSTAEPSRLGVNGMSSNWSGPNGLVLNGLGSNWSGPNGVQPGSWPGPFDGTGQIVSSQFAEWFAADPAARYIAMIYFVRCAYDSSTVIRYTDPGGKVWTWPGQFGLAQTTFLNNARMSADEGRWVSACLVAHVNMNGEHQYISLRGNPPLTAIAARAALAPTAAERWTMSFPEGVWSGDTFMNPGAGGYTVVLNVPASVATSVWQPPNLVLGRKLDFGGWAPTPLNGANSPFMVIMGDYVSGGWRFTPSSSAVDPDYPHDTVCAGPQNGPGCGTAGPMLYRPLFVHEPRLANFEDRSPASSATTMQVVDTGTTAISANQVRVCASSDECIGTLPTGGGSPGAGAKLVELKDGQAVQGVLRLTQAMQQTGFPVPPASQAYTAIVRYASAQPASARVRVSLTDGTLQDLGVVQWGATGGPDSYRWLQVYPVYATPAAAGGGSAAALATLRIEIAGASPDGKTPPAPQLDAVGFVPGWPWCSAQAVPFHQSCPK